MSVLYCCMVASGVRSRGRFYDSNGVSFADCTAQMVELSKLMRELKQVLYGDSESEPVAEACTQLTQEFFREDTLRLLITCLPKLNLEVLVDQSLIWSLQLIRILPCALCFMVGLN